MQIVPTYAHGIIDYLTGILLVLAPFLFGFATGGPEQWVPLLLGITVILYSLLTDYEVGAVRLIPVRVHLAIDMVGGAFLLASPWLFGFADKVFWPHVLVEATSIIIPILTVRTPRPRPAGVLRGTER